MDGKATGTLRGLQDMLFYHINALIEEGDPDPCQTVATEIGKIINLSKEQVDFVRSEISDSVKLSDNLSLSIKLLEGIEKKKTLDMESIVIVRKTLETIVSMLEDNKVQEDN